MFRRREETVVEVLENKSSAAVARPAELQYRLVVDGMEEGVVVHDAQGIIRACNPSAERILGVKPLALIGRRSVLELCNPVDADGAPFALEGCPALVSLHSQASLRAMVIGIKDGLGLISWLSFSSHPLVTADGASAGVVTSFCDITASRDREELSARRSQEAQNTVRLHDEFLATAAHELRTPLTALRLLMQNLVRNSASTAALTQSALVAKLQSAVRQTDRLNTFIELLLDVSRITVSRLELRRTQVSLRQLVEEVVARHVDELEASGVPAAVEGEELVGHWDGQRLDQVVTNLLSNALKYGNRKPVSFKLSREGDHARLEVSDAGLGISPSDHRRIFERFQRAHLGGPQTGLGIGLWVVREIVEAHGGRVEVTSVPDVGSTFTVWLPLEVAA